jgi:hypothetical protein
MEPLGFTTGTEVEKASLREARLEITFLVRTPGSLDSIYRISSGYLTPLGDFEGFAKDAVDPSSPC